MKGIKCMGKRGFIDKEDFFGRSMQFDLRLICVTELSASPVTSCGRKGSQQYHPEVHTVLLSDVWLGKRKG